MAKRPVPPSPAGVRGLRRDPALLPLSREHHGALVQAMGLRRAAAAADRDAAVRAAESYLAYFRDVLTGHFADEESVVLPRTEASDPEGTERVRAEHREIAEATARLGEQLAAGGRLSGLLAELGDRIHDHVRFEERAYFTALQADLDEPLRRELGRELEERRTARGAPGCALPG